MLIFYWKRPFNATRNLSDRDPRENIKLDRMLCVTHSAGSPAASLSPVLPLPPPQPRSLAHVSHQSPPPPLRIHAEPADAPGWDRTYSVRIPLPPPQKSSCGGDCLCNSRLRVETHFIDGHSLSLCHLSLSDEPMRLALSIHPLRASSLRKHTPSLNWNALPCCESLVAALRLRRRPPGTASNLSETSVEIRIW